MNFKFVFFSAALGVAMASCSNEEIESNLFTEQNSIGFNVVSNSMQRATPTTNDNLTSTDFNVYAFTPKGELYLGSSGLGANIKYNDSKSIWDYTSDDDRRYWPANDTPLDFYAVNPAAPVTDLSGIYGWVITKDNKQIYYVCNPNEFTGTYKNIDIMYAIANGRTAQNTGGTVKLQFKHTLSQVVFKAKTKSADIDVIINGIDIKNVKMSGTFTLPANSETDATQSNWDAIYSSEPTPGNEFPYFRAVYNAETEIKGSKTDATDLSSDNPLLIIPQKLDKWDVGNEDIYNANTNKHSYLAIECKIKQNGILLFGSADKFETLYVPFEADWQPGKRYIYTLIFGGGYNDQGKPILTPIKIEAESTSDWLSTSDDSEIEL